MAGGKKHRQQRKNGRQGAACGDQSTNNNNNWTTGDENSNENSLDTSTASRDEQQSTVSVTTDSATQTEEPQEHQSEVAPQLAAAVSDSPPTKSSSTSVSAVTSQVFHLGAASRLETMAQVLSLLEPVELRYAGALLEHQARKDAAVLRELEVQMNNVDYVRQLVDNCDDDHEMIGKTIVGLSLLHSTNRRTATVFAEYLRKFADSFDSAFGGCILTDNGDDYSRRMLDSAQLAYAAAVYHPALPTEIRIDMEQCRSLSCMHGFREKLAKFVQQQQLQLQHQQLQSQLLQQQPQHSAHSSSIGAAYGSAVCSTCSRPSTSNCAITSTGSLVTNIECDMPPLDDNCKQITCLVTWTDGVMGWCVLSTDEIWSFHHLLLEKFPMEAGMGLRGRRFTPYLQDSSPTCCAQYLRNLADVPARMLSSKIVASFFKHSRHAYESNTVSSVCTPPNYDHASTPRVSSATLSLASLALSDLDPGSGQHQHGKDTRRKPSNDASQKNSVVDEGDDDDDDTGQRSSSVSMRRTSEDRRVSCPNCAQAGHSFSYCPATSMNEIRANGEFKLNYYINSSELPLASHKRHSSASGRLRVDLLPHHVTTGPKT